MADYLEEEEKKQVDWFSVNLQHRNRRFLYQVTYRTILAVHRDWFEYLKRLIYGNDT